MGVCLFLVVKSGGGHFFVYVENKEKIQAPHQIDSEGNWNDTNKEASPLQSQLAEAGVQNQRWPRGHKSL